MKLRNKKTGEIGEIGYIGSSSGKLTVSPINRVVCESIASYNSLAELNEEWEDYEEPKEYYFIRDDGSGVGYSPIGNSTVAKRREIIGNYFDTREEAEKAVEKLKAWKRLKDNGFKFKRWEIIDGRIDFMILPKGEYREKVYEDLDLLFGGEE